MKFCRYSFAAFSLVAFFAHAIVGAQESPDQLGKESGAAGRKEWISAENIPIGDLTTGVIDNRRIYDVFVNRGKELLHDDRIVTDQEMFELLKSAPEHISLSLGDVPPVAPGEVLERMTQASLMVGTLYDCGRCSNIHGNISGGVVISSDGLALTNYHVLSRNDAAVKGLAAMNHQGQCFAISEVLATSKKDDVALIRLVSDTPFKPVPIAADSPKALDRVMVLSHPHNEFYVLSTGIASRLTKPTMSGDSATWLEITAEFSGGSSGSGVFNERGELVGLVSRIHTLFRTDNMPGDPRRNGPNGDNKGTFAEQILRRCVPVEAIRSMFEVPQ
ncbi:MAG: serine protease [Pirellula sp.]